jgi:iron complex transport system substrate-binding protein
MSNVMKFEELLRSSEELQAKLRSATEAFAGDKTDEQAVFEAIIAPLAEEAGLPFTYDEAKALAADAKTRPTVFSGEMHGGNWYAVGGKNFLAQLFRDAGADYVVKNEDTGGSNIEFEQMYAMAANADYWRILNSYPDTFSYDALKASEPRNDLFKAFREKHVIYCNMKQTAYYETTPVEPDVLLKDLLAIFHPELVEKDYKPKYYQLLK